VDGPTLMEIPCKSPICLNAQSFSALHVVLARRCRAMNAANSITGNIHHLKNALLALGSFVRGIAGSLKALASISHARRVGRSITVSRAKAVEAKGVFVLGNVSPILD